MVDYAMDIYRELHGDNADIPVEMEEQKKQVLEKLEELKAEAGCKAFEDLCQNEELRVCFFYLCFLTELILFLFWALPLMTLCIFISSQ